MDKYRVLQEVDRNGETVLDSVAIVKEDDSLIHDKTVLWFGTIAEAVKWVEDNNGTLAIEN